MAEANLCHSCNYKFGFLALKFFDISRNVPATKISANSFSRKLQFIKEKLIVLLGHGKIATTLKEALAALMLRNYPEVLDFTDESEFVIFIPDYYLNSIKVADYVDPSKGEEYGKNCETAAGLYPERIITVRNKKKKRNEIVNEFTNLAHTFFEGRRISYYGEPTEKKLYHALKKRYERTNEKVVVFHALDLMKFDQENTNFDEKDFILINATHGYVMAIEAKKNLAEKKDSKEKDSLVTALNQLERTMKDLQTFFTSNFLKDEDSLSSNWISIPMIYTSNLEFRLCQSDLDHVIEGM